MLVILLDTHYEPRLHFTCFVEDILFIYLLMQYVSFLYSRVLKCVWELLISQVSCDDALGLFIRSTLCSFLFPLLCFSRAHQTHRRCFIYSVAGPAVSYFHFYVSLAHQTEVFNLFSHAVSDFHFYVCPRPSDGGVSFIQLPGPQFLIFTFMFSRAHQTEVFHLFSCRAPWTVFLFISHCLLGLGSYPLVDPQMRGLCRGKPIFDGVWTQNSKCSTEA